jgi:hypothetical protein
VRASPLSRLLTRLLKCWARVQHGLQEYERRNLAEWRYWGTKRAARELGVVERTPTLRRGKVE